MKQITSKILLLCLILIISFNLNAQTESCERKFTIKTTATESTCMANGSITVTFEGDITNIMTNRSEYAVRPINGTEGTSIPFTTNNVLSGMAPGTYIVSIRTYCTVSLEEVGVVTEATNIVVPGTYKPLMATLDQNRTRKSYTKCSTGLIAFNIQNGTGYGSKTFEITKAPLGVALGEVVPIPSSELVSGQTPYELTGLYPPGDYQIDIKDGCSTATLSFNLGSVSDLPNPDVSFTRFAPKGAGQSCNEVKWTPGNVINNETNILNHHYKHFQAGLYEIALLPKDQVPSESDWTVWTANPTLTYTLPGTYKDYSASGSLVGYIRVKDCSEEVKSQNAYLKSAALYSPRYYNYCNHFKYYGTIYNHDRDGFWCFPLSIKVINNATSEEIHSSIYSPTSTSSSSVLDGVELKYGNTYTYSITDASGHVQSGTMTSNFTPTVNFNSYTYSCSTFKTTLLLSSYWYCYPTVKIYKENDLGGFDLYDTITMTSNTQSVEYPYGKYKLEAIFPRETDGSPDPYTYTSNNISVNSQSATAATLTSNTYTSSSYGGLDNQNYGHLAITSTSGGAFPTGTTFTITKAPDGYIHQGRVFTSTASATSWYICNASQLYTQTYYPQTYMPTGEYEVTIDTGCGIPFTSLAILNTGYNAENVKFKIEETGCEGGYLMMDLEEGGYVTLKGISSSSYSNFRILKGPSGGYEDVMKKYNEKLLLTADGEYTIGIISSISYPTNYLKDKTFTIRYTQSKPTLNPSVTSAYVCADPGAFLGHIMFTGQGGKAPYNYRLLKEDGTPTGLSAIGNDGERIDFNYGLAGESYIVEITDACGNSTTQRIQLADLKQQAIVYKIPAESDYCTGDVINLNCITLGKTTYQWHKKNPDNTYTWISNEQNPRISNATTDDSGWYRVTVTPEYCGDPMQDEVEVIVRPPLTAGAVSENQEVCAGTRVQAMNCTISGGKGIYNYQWQLQNNDDNTWGSVVGATNATYAPLHGRDGTYYYRLQVTDDCDTIFSDYITITVKSCYILVNPNIRSRVSK